MEFFDLNLTATKSKKDNLVDALANLIARSTHEINHHYDLITYDELTHTLIINDPKHHLNLNDFMLQTSVPHNAFSFVLRLVISNLLADHLHVTFQSSYGTFAPTIGNQKADNTNILLAYDNLQVINNQATIINIWPISVGIVKLLKARFCALQTWQQVIPTPTGTIYVRDNNMPHNFFLNGKNITNHHQQKISLSEAKKDAYTNDYWTNELIKTKHACLFFSYDFKGYNPKFNGKEWSNGMIDDKMAKCIIKIYRQLSEADQAFIFNQIVNNYHSYEWRSLLIQKFITWKLLLLNPNKYVLASIDNYEHQNFIDFATMANKQILWLHDVETNINQANLLCYFAYDYVDKHYQHLSFKKLNQTERQNWTLLRRFLTIGENNHRSLNHPYTFSFTDTFGTMFKQNVYIVQHLPNHQWSFSFASGNFYVDRCMLSNPYFAPKVSFLLSIMYDWLDEGDITTYYGLAKDSKKHSIFHKESYGFDASGNYIGFVSWLERFNQLEEKYHLDHYHP